MILDTHKHTHSTYSEERRVTLVIREVTDKAWEYIDVERNKLVDPDDQHWYFSRERYDGTVYITVTEEEDKSGVIAMLNTLLYEFGMTVLPSASAFIAPWLWDAEQSRQNEIRNALQKEWSEQLRRIKIILRDGCKGCQELRVVRRGLDDTDVDAYCVADGKERLDTVTSWQYGETREGTTYRGNKYIPCEECKYLKEQE